MLKLNLLTTMGLAVTLLATATAEAQMGSTPHVIGVAHGGGTAVFTDAESDPDAVGTTTQFGVGGMLFMNELAEGNFSCMIPGEGTDSPFLQIFLVYLH